MIEMIPYCINENIALTPCSPLARGQLARPRTATTKRSQEDMVLSWLYKSAKDSDYSIIDFIGALAKKYDKTRAEIALAWLLNRPGISSIILGVTKVNQLKNAIQSLGIKLSEEELTHFDNLYTPHLSMEYK